MDRVLLAVYLVDWQCSGALGEKRVKYEHTGVEAVYCLSNPITDIVGSAVYGEGMEWERKLLLQKNRGRVRLIYNATMEAVWDGSTLGQLKERSGELRQTIGVSDEMNAPVNLGLDFFRRSICRIGRQQGGRSFLRGRIFRYGRGDILRRSRVFFRLSDQADWSAVQARGIFGVDF
jgi:hypothetical protein